MISVPANARVFVAIQSVDFRNGINGLGRICREKLREDPMSGAFFVFRNRAKTTIKIIAYDGESFWLITRRLSRGKISWWPKSVQFQTRLNHKQFQTLLLNGNPNPAEFGNDWKKLMKS